MAAGAVDLSTLGEPPKTVVQHEGVLLVRRALALKGETAEDIGYLTIE